VHTKIKPRKGHGIAAMTLILLVGVGCSRPVTVPNDAAFQAGSGKPASSEPVNPSLAVGESSAAANKLPFREQENLPAGTLISVRLSHPISISGSTENSSFEAVVVDPVVVEGATLIPKGTPVTGRVESARTSQLKPNRGYVRLTLASVHAGGIDVPVQTASLFARQTTSADQSAPAIGLEKGRRLTFSLTEPVYIASPQAKTDR
jgi:hypothetical protein